MSLAGYCNGLVLFWQQLMKLNVISKDSQFTPSVGHVAGLMNDLCVWGGSVGMGLSVNKLDICSPLLSYSTTLFS